VNPAEWSIGVRGAVLICIAIVVISELLGVPLLRWAKAREAPSSENPTVPGAPSLVVWNESTILVASDGNPVRGQFIARRCETCHGIEGFSSRSSTPNLAGLESEYTWKQLDDFRSGKRKSIIMQRVVSAPSSGDSADVAAYFSMLPSTPDTQFNPSFQTEHAGHIVNQSREANAFGGRSEPRHSPVPVVSWPGRLRARSSFAWVAKLRLCAAPTRRFRKRWSDKRYKSADAHDS
jgi:cytochrome c553